MTDPHQSFSGMFYSNAPLKISNCFQIFFQLINSTLSTISSSSVTNWVDVPSGYNEPGDWYDTLWGPGFITFKTDIYAGTVTIRMSILNLYLISQQSRILCALSISSTDCHVLIHEDQGAMGTAYIRNGCDGDYQDVAGDGACDYVDTCGQFGNTLAPSPSPTNPTKSPTTSPSSSPTSNPTKNPVNQRTSVDLQLELRGLLSKFVTEADSYSNGDTTVLAEMCIEDVIDVDTNPELSEVTITVTSVERGSVNIYYTLTAYDRDLLTLAENNVFSKVEAGDEWVADPGSDQSFKLMNHYVINAQYFLLKSNDDDEWWISAEFWTFVILGMMVTCCICGGIILYKYKRKRMDGNKSGSMEMGQTSGNPAMHQPVYSNSVVCASSQKDLNMQ